MNRLREDIAFRDVWCSENGLSEETMNRMASEVTMIYSFIMVFTYGTPVKSNS